MVLMIGSTKSRKVRLEKMMKFRKYGVGLASLVWAAALIPYSPVGASEAEEQQTPPEQMWLLDNFSGPFTWSFIDLETGEVTATGRGNCEGVYGGLFLRCVHKTNSGEELGVGISGYDSVKGAYQWVFYGAGGSAMLYGEGYRDAEAETSYIEGFQKLPDTPKFKFRTVTKKLSDGEWAYSHYRLDGETPVEMFRAVFSYNVNNEK